MYTLTDKLVDIIVGKIINSNIKSKELKEDLIDHFCCLIEEYLNKGLNFEESLNKAYQDICLDGFDEIQKDTLFLLTSKKIKTMKRLLFVSGYLSAIGVTTTLFMKLAGIPGGQIVLLLTLVVIFFLFLPALFNYLYKREIVKSFATKLNYIFGAIGAALLIAFVAFKISHWPGQIFILFAALLIINFISFPFLFYKVYQKNRE